MPVPGCRGKRLRSHPSNLIWLAPAKGADGAAADTELGHHAGAGVGVLAVLGGTGVGRSYRSYGSYGPDASVPRQRAVNSSVFFALLAFFLFGLGLALDYLL